MHLLVLSAFRPVGQAVYGLFKPRLNAPFGAQCFPTSQTISLQCRLKAVSMHLLVLSAFRRGKHLPAVDASVSMHLLVLSAFRLASHGTTIPQPPVSMHLLVLSAFRREEAAAYAGRACLNAPFGAQCFPTLNQA